MKNKTDPNKELERFIMSVSNTDTESLLHLLALAASKLSYEARMEAVAKVFYPNGLTGADAVAHVINEHCASKTKEYFYSIPVTSLLDPLGTPDEWVVAQGSMNNVSVTMRDIFQNAVKYGAPNLVVAHNHPYDDAKPSRTDDILTHQILDASEVMDIKVVDHIIVGRKNDVYDIYSYKEHHKSWNFKK